MTWSQSFMEFLHTPPTWAALLILLFAVWVINYFGEMFAFFVAIALGAFIWFALGTFVASLALGWTAVAWVFAAFILLYNMGWLVEKERYSMLTINLLLVFVIATVVGTQAYQMSFWLSFGTSFVVVIAYLVVGLIVAYFKWWFYNRRKLDEALEVKAHYFAGLKQRHQAHIDVARRYAEWSALPANERNLRGREPEKPVFDQAGLDAIAALSADFRELQKMPVPDALKAAYVEHISDRMRVPTAFESKQRFFAWLAAWPGVFIHMIFAEIIERLWKWVYEFIENRLNAVQRRIFKGNEEFLKIR